LNNKDLKSVTAQPVIFVAPIHAPLIIFAILIFCSFVNKTFFIFAVVQFVERHGRAYLLLEENEESFVYTRTKNQNGKDYWRCKDWHKHKCSGRAVTDLKSLLNSSGFHCHPSNLTHHYTCIGDILLQNQK
jgi:hypothetical protein